MEDIFTETIGYLPTRWRIMDTFQSPDQFSEPYYNRRDSMAIRVYTYLTWTYMKKLSNI